MELSPTHIVKPLLRVSRPLFPILSYLQLAHRAEVGGSEHCLAVGGLTLGSDLLSEMTPETLYLRHTLPVESVVLSIVVTESGEYIIKEELLLVWSYLQL